AQHSEWSRSNREFRFGNSFAQFFLKNIGSRHTALVMSAVSEIPWQKELIASAGCRRGKCLPEIFFHNEDGRAVIEFICRVACMKADEEIRLIIIRNSRSGFVIEGNVGTPSQQDGRSEPGLKRCSQLSCESQREVLFHH